MNKESGGRSPLVCIIVLNYNGKDCLLGCLASLEKLRYARKEVLVVDNGSQDGSLEAARLAFPHYTYLESEKNLGFAGGMNIGLREALRRGAEWCWLFNNDAQAEENSLITLLAAAEAYPRGGVFSPLIREKDSDQIWFGGGRIQYWRMRAEHSVPPQTDGLSPRVAESEFLTGCAMFIRSKVLRTIGLLDEEFFLYYEDADFCLRAREVGYGTFVVPSACIRHAEKSQANARKIYFLVYSGLVFFQKHAPWYFRPYLLVYVTIRKMKNRIDMLLGSKSAALVRQAYDDFKRRTKTARFSDSR